jgi:hypothetical protein
MIENLESLASRGWPIITPIVGFLIWIIRLEARAIQNSRAIDQERTDRIKEHTALERRLLTQRSEDREDRERDTKAMHQTLAEIRKEVGEGMAEVRRDIKDLLRHLAAPKK